VSAAWQVESGAAVIPVEAYKLWRSVVVNHDRLEHTALELFAHPDAKPEHIAAVRETLINSRERVRRMHMRLVERNNSRLLRIVMPKFMEPRRETLPQ
jgi:hypothetical protein